MKEFYSFEDWKRIGKVKINITDKEESIRKLKEMGLPTIEIKRVLYTNLYNEDVEEFTKKYSPLIVICKPLCEHLPKSGKMNVTNLNEIKKLVDELTQPKNYEFYLIEMVQPLKESYVGVAISDSYGNLIAEFLKKDFLTDIRELTSCGADPKYLTHLIIKRNKEIKTPQNIPKEDLDFIRTLVQKRGYFEFIKGLKKDKPGIYFTEFQDKESFMKLIETLYF